MHIVHVFIHIKDDKLEEFITASVENAKNSMQEPGVARFDLLQGTDDPSLFLLVEVYRTVEDAAKHKETSHYKQWHDIVEPLMKEERTRTKYRNVYPGESGWG